MAVARSRLSVLVNPVRSTMRVALSLAESEHAEIALYDPTGRKVVVFLNSVIDAGDHTYSWDMADHTGNALPTGVYILQAQFSTHTLSRKIVRL